MRLSGRILLTSGALLFLLGYNNCSRQGFEVRVPASVTVLPASDSTPIPVAGVEPNVMKVNVGCGYVNQPCVSVRLCEPGTDNCQTINNILLDTGSFGLRVFSSLVSVSLPQRMINGSSLAQCTSYADGTSNWGPVKTADVVLGSLRAPGVAIQLIDAGFPGLPTDCTRPDASPAAAHYNGILGVGLFTEDCGLGCATNANNRIYFSCTSTTCNPTAVPLAQQVSNPVSSLPTHNNGIVIQMPSLPSAGSTSAFGYLILGIGTETNNAPQKTNFFQADGNGHFQTVFNGTTYNSAFIDSGSNGYFFPAQANLPLCDAKSAASGFYCPSQSLTFSAVQAGISGSPRVQVDFEIANAFAAITGNNFMFSNLGGNFPGTFNWGMPFYFGKTVFHGIEGKASPLGTGPYWAW